MLHAAGVPSSIILAQSAVAVSHTGDTNETTLATVTIPAGAMGANGQIEIETLWSYTNSGNNKNFKVKFGGVSFTNATATTTATAQTLTRIANRNSAASQVGFVASSSNGLGTSTGSVVTANVDTSADVTLLITGSLALGSETITLESYIVKLFPKA